MGLRKMHTSTDSWLEEIRVSSYPTCPGISKFVRPTPEYLVCPKCHTRVEIWSDEQKAKCERCGATVSRVITSCLDYCAFADKCRKIIEEKKIGG